MGVGFYRFRACGSGFLTFSGLATCMAEKVQGIMSRIWGVGSECCWGLGIDLKGCLPIKAIPNFNRFGLVKRTFSPLFLNVILHLPFSFWQK